MSIKSDRWIRSKCELPVAEVKYGVRVGFQSAELTDPIYHREDMTVEEQAVSIANARGTIQGRENPHVVKRLSLEHLQAKGAAFKPMISPYSAKQIREITQLVHSATDGIENDVYEKRKVISSGQTSYGYDVTLDNEFAIFTNINSSIIDPLDFDEKTLHKVVSDTFVILPPNSYLLARTKEWFNIPRDVLVVCLGKSTYARCGAIVNVTPIEPEFCGNVVIEISNSTNLPMKIYAHQGIAQFLFFQSDEVCETSYADRNDGKGGKYQGQTGITLAKG